MVVIEPVDAGSFTIVIAFDYLAAEFVPEVSPSWFDCTLSSGLSTFSMERPNVDERSVGGEKVTPIMTIRARGESGLLKCENVVTPGPGGLNSLRAVVLPTSAG